MKARFGVEMSIIKDTLSGPIAGVVKEVATIANIIDHDQQMFIVGTEIEARTVQEYLNSKDLFEDLFEIIQVENPDMTDQFTDYGFRSLSDNVYLFREMIAAFSIEKGDLEQLKMALYQIEEYLIGIESVNETNYYLIDRNFIDLINGFAKAYDIEVSFFNLDKLSEND